MVVKIHKSNPGIAGALRYNERKVLEKEATILCTANIGSTELAVINRVFAERERLMYRKLEHTSFQMSVNPSETDRISESQISDYVTELMKGLGYGDQPWVLFRHEDTGRTHYHVVSIRVDERGRKIRDYYENRECRKLVESLAAKYGYVYGRSEQTRRAEIEKKVFTRGCGETVSTIRGAINDSLSYSFTTERQFAEILKAHGVSAVSRVGNDGRVHLVFQGTDEGGRACTPMLTEEQIGVKVWERMSKRSAESVYLNRSGEKKATKVVLDGALEGNTTLEGAIRELRARGVDLIIYRDKEGAIRAATVIDHTSKAAFKLSEIGRGYGLVLSGIGALVESREEGQRDKDESHTIEAEGASQTEEINLGLRDALLTAFSLIGSGGTGKELLDPMRKHRKRGVRR